MRRCASGDSSPRLSPDEAEVHGLVALMELQSSRLAARLDPSGEVVLLADQDRRRWDQLHIHLGLAALERAEALRPEPGPYTLQAAIAACHSRASSVEATDWPQIVVLYERLVDATGSPVIELNRAVAVSMASGPTDGLRLVDALAASGTLDRYHLFHSVRGDLLDRLGRDAEAADAFARPPRSRATTRSARCPNAEPAPAQPAREPPGPSAVGCAGVAGR